MPGGYDGKGERRLEHQGKCLFHTAVVAGAEVVAYDRLCALCETLHGKKQHLAHAEKDGHGPYIEVIAVFLHARIKSELYETFRGLHDERSNSQRDDGKEHSFGYMQMFPSYAQDTFAAA